MNILEGILGTDSRITTLLTRLGLKRNKITTSSIHIGEGTSKTIYLNDLELPLTKECIRILCLARLEARKTGCEQIGNFHLIKAILNDKRDNSCKRFLLENGITIDKLFGNTDFKKTSSFGLIDKDGQEDFPKEDKANTKTTASPTISKRADNNDTPMLDRYGVDLTARAREGVLDPIVGREKETLRIAEVLTRRKKNNPILIGQPGVGKSAVVEGLALLIENRRAPRPLLDKRIVALDLTSIVAGTQYRGQFEERLQRIKDELRTHSNIILFIDEIHTIIGAGSATGTLDAANILKPALARGEVQCIGATTLDEYRKSIEKDGALDRRFQRILITPTTVDETRAILTNIVSRYEEHHGVTYTSVALDACVTLTNRYITDRSFPDKAIDALDEAGARVAMIGVSIPSNIKDMEKKISRLTEEKMTAAESQDYERAALLRDEVHNATSELNKMMQHWREQTQEERPTVEERDVALVVEMMSGVPAGRMKKNEEERLRALPAALKERVVAQDEAINKLVRSIVRSRVGLKDRNRPIGTFLFVGPTGVGKTHLVKSLALQMFDSEDSLIRIDMSEYGEKYSTSRLMGAPPGYVGYDEGGQLTERVRRKPYSVILLDEIEKAHPDVFNTLLQVMDEGRMTDGNGVTVDFRNTIIIMTSNSGTRQLSEFGTGIGFDTNEKSASFEESIIKKALRKQFAPEFLGRLDDIIMFHALNKDSAMRIVQLEIDALSQRLKENSGLSLRLTSEAQEHLVTTGFDKKRGARSLKRAIAEQIEDPLCDILLQQENVSQELIVDVKDGKLIFVNKD